MYCAYILSKRKCGIDDPEPSKSRRNRHSSGGNYEV
jgi:hypothetical protein